MRTFLALCLVAIVSFITTACMVNDANIPSTVARALAAQDDGGQVLTEIISHDGGLANYTYLVCNQHEKVVQIRVYGMASKPQVQRTGADTELYCGSRSRFWKSYEEKSPNSIAIREEMVKLEELIGLKKED